LGFKATIERKQKKSVLCPKKEVKEGKGLKQRRKKKKTGHQGLGFGWQSKRRKEKGPRGITDPCSRVKINKPRGGGHTFFDQMKLGAYKKSQDSLKTREGKEGGLGQTEILAKRGNQRKQEKRGGPQDCQRVFDGGALPCMFKKEGGGGPKP